MKKFIEIIGMERFKELTYLPNNLDHVFKDRYKSYGKTHQAL